MTPAFGSPGSEWLLCELDFNLAHDTCPWLTRKWVASVVSCVWTLLMTPFLGSPVCELLLW